MKTAFLSISLVFTSGVALAATNQTHLCKNSGMQRRVEVVDNSGPDGGSCQVNYHKDTEAPGEVKVLWSAEHEAGFCTRKADQFLKKLEGWGWTCVDGQTTAH